MKAEPTGVGSACVVAALVAAAFVVLLASGDAAGATRHEDVVISVISTPSRSGTGESRHGYQAFRVHLANQSAQRSKRVQIELPADSYGSDGQVRRITRTVDLAPQAETVVSLLQPPVMMRGSDMIVRVAGRPKRVSLTIEEHGQDPRGYFAYAGKTGRSIACVLTSQSIDANFRAVAESRSPGDLLVYRSETPIEAWATQWLAYSRYDGVVLTGRDLSTAPAPVLEALRQYVSCGGSLTVLGATSPPEDWGAGMWPDGGTRISRGGLGFGEIIAFPSDRLSGLNSPDYIAMRSAWDVSAAPWRRLPDADRANRKFPVVEERRIPAQGLLVLMIAFAVLIGPVNLFVLARKRRRLWLLWTVPAISLVTCLAIYGYAMAAEGFSGHERTHTLTLLDQDRQHATTLGWTGFYSPLTPGDGLRFSTQTEVTALLSGDGGRERSLDWTDDQHLSRGWVAARIPAHFLVRKTSDLPVRERLTFKRRADGSIDVTNGLGVDLTGVTYRDRDGRIYARRATIDAGATANLAMTSEVKPRFDRMARQLYDDDWLEAIRRAGAAHTAWPTGARYIAEAAASPFLESGLNGSGERRLKSVIIGFFEGEALP